MYLSYCSPRILGFRVFFEFSSDTRVHKYLDWALDERDTLIWLWKFHLIVSDERRLGYGQEGDDEGVPLP